MHNNWFIDYYNFKRKTVKRNNKLDLKKKRKGEEEEEKKKGERKKRWNFNRFWQRIPILKDGGDGGGGGGGGDCLRRLAF